MDFNVEKKLDASPTITQQESKEDVEYQYQREPDEHPAQPLLEVLNFRPSLLCGG